MSLPRRHYPEKVGGCVYFHDCERLNIQMADKATAADVVTLWRAIVAHSPDLPPAPSTEADLLNDVQRPWKILVMILAALKSFRPNEHHELALLNLEDVPSFNESKCISM
jgi:hypothetical protein